jgi:hypothetical protein
MRDNERETWGDQERITVAIAAMFWFEILGGKGKDSHNCAATIANIWCYYKVFKKMNGNKKNRPNWIKLLVSWL